MYMNIINNNDNRFSSLPQVGDIMSLPWRCDINVDRCLTIICEEGLVDLCCGLLKAIERG